LRVVGIGSGVQDIDRVQTKTERVRDACPSLPGAEESYADHLAAPTGNRQTVDDRPPLSA
jgi:hypothetical protein